VRRGGDNSDALRDDEPVTVRQWLYRRDGRFAGVETIGRRLGSAAFLDRLAALAGRDPRPRERGSPARGKRE
jgi:hypothetical protein